MRERRGEEWEELGFWEGFEIYMYPGYYYIGHKWAKFAGKCTWAFGYIFVGAECSPDTN
jgi:hypothetical protein